MKIIVQHVAVIPGIYASFTLNFEIDRNRLEKVALSSDKTRIGLTQQEQILPEIGPIFLRFCASPKEKSIEI